MSFQSSDDPRSFIARERQILDARIVRHAKTFLQQRGIRLLQDAEATASDSQLVGDAHGSSQGKLHQRSADGRDRWLDQLDVLRFRHHQSSIPVDAAIQADVAARSRIAIAGRLLGVVRLMVFPQRLRIEKHLHAGTGREQR